MAIPHTLLDCVCNLYNRETVQPKGQRERGREAKGGKLPEHGGLGFFRFHMGVKIGSGLADQDDAIR